MTINKSSQTLAMQSVFRFNEEIEGFAYYYGVDVSVSEARGYTRREIVPDIKGYRVFYKIILPHNNQFEIYLLDIDDNRQSTVRPRSLPRSPFDYFLRRRCLAVNLRGQSAMAQYKHLPIYRLTHELLHRSVKVTKEFSREYKYSLKNHNCLILIDVLTPC